MDRKALNNLASQIAESARVHENSVFVDASRASSMPLTPTKEEISSILLVDKERAYETPISEIPLIDSVTGLLDTLRVYTTPRNRDAVKRSVKKVLGEDQVHLKRRMKNGKMK